MKKIIFLFPIFLFAESINYVQSDIHTFTQTPKKVNFYINYLKINKTLDVFHIRDSSLLNRYSSIGDMKGYQIGTRYGITDKLMYSISYTKQDIQFFGDYIVNARIDNFFRYHLFEPLFSKSSGLSIDIGYIQNSMKDFKTTDINSINSLIKRYLPGKDASIFYADGNTKYDGSLFPLSKGYYLNYDNTKTKLNEAPSISLVDTNDKSFYVRFLTGFYTIYNLLDFYTGIKKTKIKGKTSSTDELIDLGKTEGYNLIKNFNRYETSAFFGINDSYKYKKFVFEANYKYIRIFRKKELDYINYNHILTASVSYFIKNNLLLTIGGKILYRQFDGEIPYLYNKYTQTTFDHKYGYAMFGINYSF